MFQTYAGSFFVTETAENGEILNAEKLGNIYVDLCRKYYGEDLVIDEYNKYNWTRVNHFFRCFYVYKYATGISCAIDIASRILSPSGFRNIGILGHSSGFGDGPFFPLRGFEDISLFPILILLIFLYRFCKI